MVDNRLDCVPVGVIMKTNMSGFISAAFLRHKLGQLTDIMVLDIYLILNHP